MCETLILSPPNMPMNKIDIEQISLFTCSHNNCWVVNYIVPSIVMPSVERNQSKWDAETMDEGRLFIVVNGFIASGIKDNNVYTVATNCLRAPPSVIWRYFCRVIWEINKIPSHEHINHSRFRPIHYFLYLRDPYWQVVIDGIQLSE